MDYIVNNYGVPLYFFVGVSVFILLTVIVGKKDAEAMMPFGILIVPAWPVFVCFVVYIATVITILGFVAKVFNLVIKMIKQEIS